LAWYQSGNNHGAAEFPNGIRMTGMQTFRSVARRLMLARAIIGAILLCGLPANAEQRVALVIGNSAYPTARLRNPVNDARAMAAKLKALGFDVMLRTDSNLREMTRSFSQFGQKLVPGSVGLFYYAGHGMQVRGKNFLIPIDAEIETEGSVSSEAVDVDQLLNQLGPARLSMVILDACRNNPFERRYRSVSGGLAQIDAPTGTLLAYATAPGKVASDGSGSNGLYTEALLKALGMPGLKVEDVFKQVRINVVKASDGQQTPWESSSLTGEFFFRAPVKAATGNEELQQAAKERAELQKAFDDERKKREQEALAVKHEMEKLRAELLKLRESSVSAPPPVQSGRPVSETPAVAAAKPVDSAAQQRPQVALASPTASLASATAAPSATEWAPRVALLEKSRGRLTLSKAIAILLDVTSDKELSLLLTREADMKRMMWSSSCAMGADRKGDLVWGCGVRWQRPAYANDAALEYCAKAAGDTCKIVVQNGDFMEKAFLELANQLGGKTVTTVREAYMQSLSPRFPDPPPPVGSRNIMPGIGFSSIRE
jgi:uncharacterized caspase-like protein